jgi:hypothetical protein
VKAPVENKFDSDSNQVSYDPSLNSSKAHIFSHAPENTQDGCVNKQVSNNLDESGDVSTWERSSNTMEERGGASEDDDDEWEFSQLDKMAMKDAKVSNEKS